MASISDVKKRKPEHAPAHMPVREHPQTVRSIKWQAPEYVHYEKQADWYWSAVVIMAALLVSSYYLESILFAFLILVGGVAVLIYGARRPDIVTFEISGAGIRVGDRLFPYETLQSFWIFYRAGDVKELSVRSEQMLVPMIKIPLGDQDPVALREFLLDFMPEVVQEESLLEVLARLLKF
ncbi:MAG: hypothetical protein AAB367_03030 [Patescibacteria group bacterium]|mgnify:CR=1 FL=1